MSQLSLPIVIVGGGFSGTLTAIHLSRRLPNTPVILIEDTGDAGPGTAYRNTDASAWLNVPASKMSAFLEQPLHFLEYAREQLGDGVQEGDFLPRHVYGGYLKECLENEMKKNHLLQVENRRVHDLTRGDASNSARVIFKDQTVINAAHVVLATGNQGSAFASSLWVDHACPARSTEAISKINNGDTVLIVGTGLTMIDAVLDLDRWGDAATIHIVSRNGLLPRPYAPPSPQTAPDLDHLPDSNLRRAVRLFRHAIREHEARGGDWRDLFHEIRDATPSLWKELSAKDKARFLRFISPFWEVHRHQCPPETFQKIQALLASGRLIQHRGTIVSIERSGRTIQLGLASRSRNAPTRWIEAQHLLDATGPARDLQVIADPLIQNLLRRGFLKPDAHRLGAETSADYRAVGRDNKPSSWLSVVGPMLRARYFEATAISELRLHAASAAKRISQAINAEISSGTEVAAL
jgi:uncharacterized NAD(P)/FAD-binding protein YdhS